MRRLLQTLLLCLIVTQLHAQCQEQDYIALRALYLSTSGDNWDDNTDWPDSVFFEMNPTMPAGTDVDIWYGVTTNEDGCVTDLNLRNNDLTGSISSELANLSHLEDLDLQSNQLSGSIPPGLGQLSNLIALDLHGNQLSGSIPPELGQLSNLESLNLSYNDLTGSIPPELGQLSNLIELYLHQNELSGSIPPELGNLSNLTELWLHLNQLSGSIPPELGQLSNLEYLNLRNNDLTGSIPLELGQLSNLEELFLSSNELIGSIPPELGNLDSLIILSLSYNDLTDNIPPDLGQLSNLEYLNLSNNELSGSIPPELGNLSNLTELFLYKNDLGGIIPPDFGNLSNLILLHLHYNELSGSIPPELGNLSSLRYLYLYNNQLSGCYAPNLLNLCHQLDSLYNSNELISDGNNFDAPWEDFCAMGIGVCWEYQQPDIVCLMEALEVYANEIRFELHLNPDIPSSTDAIRIIINVGTIIDSDSIQININGSALDPDAYHIYVDDEGNIYITLTQTDAIDQIIDGGILKVVIMDDLLPLMINDSLPAGMLKVIGGYVMSTDGFTKIGGSTLYGSLDAPISLALNHAYCENKGTAEIHVEDSNNYSYEWSTGETTSSIEDLDIGSYTVTVSDGMGDTTVIDFDIDWAFTPLNILVQNKKDRIYIDVEEAPLSEDVEISLDGGFTYEPEIINDVIYPLSDGTYPIWVRRVVDDCSTYIGDFTINNPIRPYPDFSEYLINPSGVTARLNYELEQHGTVDISLYNIHGQRLRTLHHARSDAGTYQIEIDKDNLPKGIYFIHVMFISADGTIAYKTLKLLI